MSPSAASDVSASSSTPSPKGSYAETERIGYRSVVRAADGEEPPVFGSMPTGPPNSRRPSANPTAIAMPTPIASRIGTSIHERKNDGGRSGTTRTSRCAETGAAVKRLRALRNSSAVGGGRPVPSSGRRILRMDSSSSRGTPPRNALALGDATPAGGGEPVMASNSTAAAARTSSGGVAPEPFGRPNPARRTRPSTPSSTRSGATRPCAIPRWWPLSSAVRTEATMVAARSGSSGPSRSITARSVSPGTNSVTTKRRPVSGSVPASRIRSTEASESRAAAMRSSTAAFAAPSPEVFTNATATSRPRTSSSARQISSSVPRSSRSRRE